MFAPLGDAALVVTLSGGTTPETMDAAAELADALAAARLPGVFDVVPAYASVAVFYDPAQVGEAPYARLCAKIDSSVSLGATTGLKGAEKAATRVIEIEVFYGGAEGPDLAIVAAHTGLREAEVTARHAGAEYRVRAIGFAPGFPYLSGLPVELATPRRSTPRTKVAAGSVGIGGAQTGVYPWESPGGWQIIGRTPLRLFDAARAEPALLRVGDRVRFRAVPADDASAPGQIEARTTAGETGAEKVRDGLRILNAGMHTTVQDLGRVGQRAVGVPLSGAMDPLAARLANLLVGNDEGAAVLEMTLLGAEIEFAADALIAVGGATFAGFATWRPVAVRAGQRIKFGPATSGCRGYLAVAGGIAVGRVLGSRSTYGRAELGGWRGRALRAGDVLPMTAVARRAAEHWWIDPRILPAYGPAPTVRVVPGAQAAEFGRAWLEQEFKVSPQSDRMGLRLGGTALARTGGSELLSSPVAPGTVQVPPDGQPIVLMADAQTIGGYPRLAHVIGVDLPLLAQLRPGDRVRFQPVPLEEAHQLWLAREYSLAMLREGLDQKFR